MAAKRKIPTLIALLMATLISPHIASGELSRPQTRVMGFDLPTGTRIRGSAALTPRTHQGVEHAYGELASGYVVAARGGSTTLFRTVSAAEAQAIATTGRYAAPLGGVEGKYFYPTVEQAVNLARSNFASQGVQTLTSVQVPNAVLQQSTMLNVAGEGQAFFFGSGQLGGLGAPSIWSYFPWGL